MPQLFNKKTKKDDELVLLATWMSGGFNSQQQPKYPGDNAISLMYLIPIWHDQPNGFWFYVEQAMSDELDSPYRQRVYHLLRVNKELIECKIFTLYNETTFTRAYENPATLAQLTPEMITIRSGCSIILRRLNQESFAGSTLGEGCPSEHRGAIYTTSQIVINHKQIISWDRGFDRNGKQIWGATMGGYIFTKTQSYEIFPE